MQHPSALPPHLRKFRPPLQPASFPAARTDGGDTSAACLGDKHFGLRRKSELDFSPSKWNEYFTRKQDVHVTETDTFRVYFHRLDENDDDDDDDLPLLVLLHGGGFSALTWSVFVKHLVELCSIRILAIDLRGHGSSITANDEDLRIATLVDDVTRILQKLYADTMPEFILMGHSMGGALAAHFVDKCTVESISNRILGLIVIDVVEGTAKEALSQMQQVLRSRPPGFKSIRHAIEWCKRSGHVRNLDAAKISMPGQIKNKQTNICAVDLIDLEEEDKSPSTNTADVHTSSSSGLSTLSETTETMEENSSQKSSNWIPKVPDSPNYIWRIDLSKTEPFWMEWFDNLSQIFLSSKGGAKLLMLAGVDRLDGPMMVGQMQGKFQMQILRRVGHIIQEDDPGTVADVVAAYLVRNRFSTPKVEFERQFPSC